MKTTLLFACTCLLITGCDLFGGDDTEIDIRTDETTYDAGPDDMITLSVSNKSEDPVFYICTGQIYLEELSGGQVANRWMVHGFEDCLSPEPIDVDEIEVWEIGFDEKSALGNIQNAAFSQSVQYRLTVDLFWDRAFKRALSDSERRSNTFSIVLTPVP